MRERMGKRGFGPKLTFGNGARYASLRVIGGACFDHVVVKLRSLSCAKPANLLQDDGNPLVVSRSMAYAHGSQGGAASVLFLFERRP